MGTTKDVREAVQAELTFDPLVDATDITVRNMNGEVGCQRPGLQPAHVQQAPGAQVVADRGEQRRPPPAGLGRLLHHACRRASS